MEAELKIVLPIAGLGTRLRPHTLIRPKPLLPLAGKTVLDFVLEKFSTLPNTKKIEYVFIVGLMGEQIKDYMDEFYPDIKVTYLVQKEMRGQADAIYVAREICSGPILISFGDSINNPDFSLLDKKGNESIVWVKSIADVSQQGVIKVGDDGFITHLYEKPKSFISNLMLVGVYYFGEGEALISAIDEQFSRGLKLNNEYYLADAINIMIERGAKIQPETVDLWLDAGTIDTLLATNAYLLDHGNDNSKEVMANWPDEMIVPPVFIDKRAQIRNSVIGPHVVIESDCQLNNVIARNSIIQKDAIISDMVIDKLIVGRNQNIKG